jgi:hypothetical protein
VVSPPVTNAALEPASKHRSIPHYYLFLEFAGVIIDMTTMTPADKEAVLKHAHCLAIAHGGRAHHLIDDWAKLASALRDSKTTQAYLTDLLGPFITALSWPWPR